MSKKLAEGINHLVLDVKHGLGTHMKTRTEAHHLAVAIERVATEIGLDTRVVLSDMNQPLGYAVGNSLEVEEAIACLKGNGPEDLIDLNHHSFLDSRIIFERVLASAPRTTSDAILERWPASDRRRFFRGRRCLLHATVDRMV